MNAEAEVVEAQIFLRDQAMRFRTYSVLFYNKSIFWARVDNALGFFQTVTALTIAFVNANAASLGSVEIVTAAAGTALAFIAAITTYLKPGRQAQQNQFAGDDYKEFSLEVIQRLAFVDPPELHVTIDWQSSKRKELTLKYPEPSPKDYAKTLKDVRQFPEFSREP